MLEAMITVAVVLLCLRIICNPVRLHGRVTARQKSCEHKFEKVADKIWVDCKYYECKLCRARRSVKEVEGIKDPGCERLKQIQQQYYDRMHR